MPPRVRTLVVLALVFADVQTRAQPPEELPRELAADVVLDDLRREYRRGPAADEVLITIRPPDGPARSDRIIVRTDCTAIGIEEGPRRVLLELGPLRVFAGDGRLLVIHTAERGVYYSRELGGPIAPELLSELLPPVPAPQLALVGADPMAIRTPLPYARGVVWHNAVLQEGSEPTTYVVTGRAEGVEAILTADLESQRVTRFTATFEGPRGATRLDLVCRAVDPGDPERWAPDLTGREPVESLAALRAPRAAPELRPGEVVPELTFLGADMTPWSLHAALRSGAAGLPGESPPSGVLLLFRAPADAQRAESIESDARAGREAIRAVAAPPGEESGGRVVERAAAVIELPDFDRDRFQRLRQRWGDGAPADTRLDSDDLLWASAGAQSADRFCRDDDAMIVVIGGDRVLRRVIHLDGRAADGAAIADELRAALEGPR